ncbi:MAG: hypothetical protein ACREQ3_23265, partial [Candidatus Binatia bacterium]
GVLASGILRDSRWYRPNPCRRQQFIVRKPCPPSRACTLFQVARSISGSCLPGYQGQRITDRVNYSLLLDFVKALPLRFSVA